MPAQLSWCLSLQRQSTLALRVNVHGFRLHTAVRWRANQRKGLEQLCRYITRPPIANERLKRNRAGQVVLRLKEVPERRHTHVVMEPLEVMEVMEFLAAPVAAPVSASYSLPRGADAQRELRFRSASALRGS